MLIFVHEDRAYLSWLAHHRQGFVMEWLRKPTRKRPVLHRATCDQIRSSQSSRKTHWTTGRHVKACALDVDELVAWAESELTSRPTCCDRCAPLDESSAGPQTRHVTKLGKEILDYIVEIAVMCLDRQSEYDMSVADVAKYLGKTVAQIQPAVARLIEDGFLRTRDPWDPQRGVRARQRLYPTADALRMLPSFAEMSRRRVQSELQQLRAKGGPS